MFELLSVLYRHCRGNNLFPQLSAVISNAYGRRNLSIREKSNKTTYKMMQDVALP